MPLLCPYLKRDKKSDCLLVTQSAMWSFAKKIENGESHWWVQKMRVHAISSRLFLRYCAWVSQLAAI